MTSLTGNRIYTSQRLLLLSPKDNVFVARCPIDKKESLQIEGSPIVCSEVVPTGFKVSRLDLQPGMPVIKYGAIIGFVTHHIQKGDIIHLHNMKSDYIETVNDTEPFTSNERKRK